MSTESSAAEKLKARGEGSDSCGGATGGRVELTEEKLDDTDSVLPLMVEVGERMGVGSLRGDAASMGQVVLDAEEVMPTRESSWKRLSEVRSPTLMLKTPSHGSVWVTQAGDDDE
jgi:hypothetical protein